MTHTLIVKNAAQLITLAGSSGAPLTGSEMSRIGLVEGGSIWIQDGIIQLAGSNEEVLEAIHKIPEDAEVLDASGKLVMPGLVDPHTHLVHAGSREEEFNMRIGGATYMEILNAGGGIHSTAEQTRKATFEELYSAAAGRLDEFLLHGVTTLEAKSGYGMDWETERKQLQVAAMLQEKHPVDVISTFMGAHAVPKSYRGHEEAFVCLVIEELLPKVAEERLAEFNDVFCERGVFTPEQSRRILEAGQMLGLKAKIHADEIESYGGAELAADIGAISADHLLKASPAGIKRMAEEGVIGVLLPGTAYFLMAEFANARGMIDGGVPVALSTDFNPGSSPTVSLPFIMNLGCLKMGMSPAEVITAATINAAHAIDRGREIGSLESGKKGDIAIFDVPNFYKLQYSYGVNHTHTVIKNGRTVVRNGQLVK
ncbi:imidazolonepropionase [Peribacillus sp. SCS-37]|uniref:imidazolonepropionase n=1 Tax=Paraperibacillus esterisolvens TaxID=3115296 RepID=UPI003905D152